LGIWKALTFAGASPDLVTEQDVIAGKLDGYRAVVLVGDHWPRELVPALERWVKAGGVALATAGSGQKDAYGEPMKEWHALAGLKSVKTEMRETFLRPRQELAFLKPLDCLTTGPGKLEMPVLATRERIEPGKDVEVGTRFESDNSPAIVTRALGKGQITYCATHPGLAFLWSGLQPPAVPDRGPNTHTPPTGWNPLAFVFLYRDAIVLQGISRPIEATPLGHGYWFDTRLLEAPRGYVLPIANYSAEVGGKVRLTVKVSKPVRKVISAYHGELKHEAGEGKVTFTIPALGYGDVLRLEKK
jgi:hypothetical protein